MKAEKIAEILQNHRLWLAGNEKGSKANLSKADLSGAISNEITVWPQDYTPVGG